MKENNIIVFLKDLDSESLLVRLFNSFIVIIISYFIYKFIIKLINKSKLNSKTNKKTKTLLRLIISIIRYIFIIVTGLIILQIFGINITSMLAGVGIIGIIIGFAIQDALKDIIKGFDIITDNYYQVGDVIKYNDITGKVLSIGLKTTKIQDLYTLNIVSVSNRNIEIVEVVSNLINIDIPLSYELKLQNTEKILNEIVDNIKQIKDVDNSEYRGINNFDNSSIKYQVKVYCNPINKVQIRRDALGVILSTLEKNNIQIPYNQLDIHNK